MEEGATPERSANPSEFVAGFLTGALAGAALAMLLTPKTGEDLRASLTETARQLSNKVRDTTDGLDDGPAPATPEA